MTIDKQLIPSEQPPVKDDNPLAEWLTRMMILVNGTIQRNNFMDFEYGGWIDGKTYYPQSVVRKDGWTVIANKETTDYPAPQPIGSPFGLYDGTLTPLTESAKVVTYGNRYSFGISAYVTSYRVDVTTGNDYEIFIIRDPLATKIQERLAFFTATTTGWVKFTIEPVIVLANSVFDLIAVTNEPPASPTPVTLSYDYLNPQNPTDPAVGTISQSRSQSDLWEVSYTDQNGDQTTTIAGLSAGDTIEGAGMTWTILVNLPQTGYASLTVSPSASGTPTGIQDFLFNTTVPTLIEYGIETDYWLSSPYPVQGLYAFDAPYDSNPPNNNAYGTDITVQQIEVSDDWDIITPGEATGGTSTQLSTREVSWIVANTETVSPYDVLTTDDTWTEVFRGMVTLNKGFKAVLVTDAKRFDATGYYSAARTFLAYDVAGVVTIIPGSISELGANLDVHAVVDGTDVVIEVQGKNGQTWSWTTTTQYKEID